MSKNLNHIRKKAKGTELGPEVRDNGWFEAQIKSAYLDLNL